MGNLQLNIHRDISKAQTLPAEFYTRRYYFDLCKEKIFAKSWQMITDIHSFDKYNSYPFYFLEGYLDEPFLLVKNEDEYVCLSNVCTHRAHVVVQDHCNLHKLQCPYHGRRYNLNGQFRSMPGFEGVKYFPTERDNLKRYSHLEWHSFIFASLNPKVNLDEILQDIDHRLINFPFHKLEFDPQKSASYEIDAHWALYCENYLEGFHVPFVHGGLAKDINLKGYNTILMENGVLQRAEGIEGGVNFHLSEKSPDAGKNIYAYYYWIFPNLMLNFYPWGLSVNIIEPQKSDVTRIRFLSYPITPDGQPSGNASNVDNVELEDQKVVTQVQKGIKSLEYESGRYSAIHEKGVHHFHRLITEFIQ